MKRKLGRRLIKILWFLSFLSLYLPASSLFSQIYPEDGYTLFVLGNLVDVDDFQEYGNNLGKLLEQCETDWTLVLNGDLVSNKLNLNENFERLNGFLTRISGLSQGKIVIIPGDRDWNETGRDGLSKVNLLEKWIGTQNFDGVYYPLRKGCPGPVFFPVREDINLLLLNTQWWNHPFNKPTAESAECDLATEDAIFEEVEAYLEDNSRGNLVLFGHHPVISHGNYGGSFPLKDWLFPVPVISTFATAFKQNIGGHLETCNENLEDFRDVLVEMLLFQFSVIYASGHEHNLEVFREKENVFLNSGAPVKGGYVKMGANTLQGSKEPGIIAIKYSASGNVQSFMYELTGNQYNLKSQALLFQAPCEKPIEQIPINNRLIPCFQNEISIPTYSLDQPDKITITANPNYQAGKWKRFFLGQHYRDSWTKPIVAPVLNLDTFARGLMPFEIGGGRQTKSLKFTSKQGLDYVFRSVDKDPSKALSYDLRSTIISLVVRDQTTTQQPYGALATSYFLDKLNLLHARPHLFSMPNSSRLEPFRSEFGGMLGMIEERPVDPVAGGISFGGAQDIKRSINLFKRMFQDRDYVIQTDEFLLARVFDMWVGDWGKHEDNWKWAGYKKDVGYVYRPIPRDRDHVFSKWDGLLPWLADREWAKFSGENFDYTIKGLRSLMWQARHLDRFIASEADHQDWIDAARLIQDKIDRKTIKDGINQMPKEVLDNDGKEIERKLNHRLDDLQAYASKYYKILAKEVDIVGSNKNELFELARQENGTVEVSMYKLRKGVKDLKYYHRIFYPSETKEIRLFGMDGKDQFVLDGEADKSILVRIIPGLGRDSILDYSRVKGIGKKTRLYERTGQDKVEHSKELKHIRGADKNAYRYNRTAFTYNKYFPILYAVVSSDNGLSINGGATFTNHAYGKPEYSSKHTVNLLLSTIGNIRFSYDGNWSHRLGNLDLLSGATIEKRKRYRYYFGLGNETTYDPDLLTEDYYTLQYTSINYYVGLQKTFWKQSMAKLIANFEYNGKQRIENTILSDIDQPILGENQLSIGQLIFELDLDFRDKQHLPLRGTRFYTHHKVSKTATEAIKSYFSGRFSAEIFATAHPFTLGIRSGYMYSWNPVPYYDIPKLGHNQFLRGFRRNRFAGDQAVYFNTDVRVVLRDKPEALIPHKFGIRLFLDQGRVFYDPEQSEVWHLGYGAGFFFTPFRERFSINLSLAFSEEESGLILFSIGSSF